MKTISIYGDSILKGVVLNNEKQRYCIDNDYNISSIEKELPVVINNYSKFGSTIVYGLDQLKNYTVRGLTSEAAVIEYGGNDCDFRWKEISDNPYGDHQPRTPFKEFKNAYLNAVNFLKQNHGIPILMSMPPVNPEKYLNFVCRGGLNSGGLNSSKLNSSKLNKENILKWLGDVNRIYRFQELYSNTIAKIAHETGSLFIDIRSAFLEKHDFDDLICADGIHPNAQGHKIILDVFCNFFKKLNDNRTLCLEQ